MELGTDSTVPPSAYRLRIPALGDKLVLVEPWTFQLSDEHRNYDLIKWLGIPDDREAREKLWIPKSNPSIWETRVFRQPATLPAGTQLIVRRIFIRQGAKGFDSVTFTAMLLPRTPPPRGKVAKPKAVRFWVKLADANTIQCVFAGGIVPGES